MLERFQPRGFDVFAGSESFLLATLRAGGAGCISATANVNPAAIAQLNREWQAPDADARQAALDGVRAAFQKFPMIPALKAAIAHFSGDAAWPTVRPPLVALTDGAAAAAAGDAERAGVCDAGSGGLKTRGRIRCGVPGPESGAVAWVPFPVPWCGCMKRLVLLGGGHSHVEVLRRFGIDPLPGAELVLVSPYPDAAYSGMLPGWIAGHYTRDECHIDLVALARFASARFVRTACNGIDPEARLVSGEDGTTLPYDVLAVDTGGGSPVLATPGATEHALPVKPVERFIPPGTRSARPGRGRAGAAPDRGGRRRRRRRRDAAGDAAPLARARADIRASASSWSSDTASILPSHNAKVRAIFMRVLAERGVTLHLGRAVVRVEAGAAAAARRRRSSRPMRSSGRRALSAPAWPKAAGLATDGRGFVRVNARLQSVSHPQVFAAGDIASVDDHPRPKSGVYAVRAGPPLAANLRRMLRGERLVEWKPQQEALALISTGDRHAVASRGDLALEGRWVWRWKDRIDRRFMQRYRIP